MEINSGCGDDIISINKTKGDINLNSGAGIRSSISVDVEDTLGDVNVDFGSAKRHTIALSNTQGNVLVDTGFRVEYSHVLIEDTSGLVDLTVGSGRLHNVSLSNTQGAAKLVFDLGDKAINAYATLGPLTASLGNGDNEVYVSSSQGDIAIKSGDGLHVYNLHDTVGIVDVAVGSSTSKHEWNLTNIEGSVSITAGDGDCIFNGYNLEGSFTGVLGNGNDQMTLENVASDFHLISGNGRHNIVGKSLGSFMAMLGNGDDNIHLTSTAGSVQVESGDGFHRGTFETTSGNIKLTVGNGNYYMTTRDTSGGDVSISTGKNYGKGVVDVRQTINGDVSIMSVGGRTNNVTVINTKDGSTSNGDVSIIVGQGSCTIEASNTDGDVYIDLQGSGNDFVGLLEVGGNTDVKTWAGNDVVTVDKLHGSLVTDLGDGDDNVNIHYLGGNGTVLGGIGDDRLMLDPLGNAGDPINTMDGSFISWNGGEGNDVVEMYLVPSGSINFNFYNMDSNQIYARCSEEGDLFNPSFSTGLQTQSVLDSLGGYLYVNVHDCCAAYFSWDTLCGENSGRQLISQIDTVLFIPNWTTKTCQSRVSSPDHKLENDQALDTFEECCKKCRSQCILNFGITIWTDLTYNHVSFLL